MPRASKNTSTTRRCRTTKTSKMTNVRHANSAAQITPETQKLLDELKQLSQDDQRHNFAIGDKVEELTSKHRLAVKVLVKTVGLSRQRLCDCRVTAKAFDTGSRRRDVPFHFFTLAARAAHHFGVEPIEALNMVYEKGLTNTRDVSSFFADLKRQRENREALQMAATLVAKHGELLGRCHHADFRDVVARLEAGSVKLAIADPSYDGKRRCSSSATIRSIDGDSEADARRDITSLLELLDDRMAPGGTVIIFRPGATLDPPWLPAVLRANGWVCRWALTWNKHKAKPGCTDAPYGIATERLLVLSRQRDKLTIHDNSSRDDVLEFSGIQPRHTDIVRQHQHEKPIDLMKHLIGKHTHEREVVLEPFGGSGSASRAAIELNRH